MLPSPVGRDERLAGLVGRGAVQWFTLENSMKFAFRTSLVLASVLTASAVLAQAQSTPPAPDPDSKPIADPAAAQAPAKPAPAEDLPDSPAPQAAALIHPNGPTAILDTSMGRVTCQF